MLQFVQEQWKVFIPLIDRFRPQLVLQIPPPISWSKLVQLLSSWRFSQWEKKTSLRQRGFIFIPLNVLHPRKAMNKERLSVNQINLEVTFLVIIKHCTHFYAIPHVCARTLISNFTLFKKSYWYWTPENNAYSWSDFITLSTMPLKLWTIKLGLSVEL